MLRRCPVCASDNVRRSRRKPKIEFLKRLMGLQRYRCRECGKVFHQAPGPRDEKQLANQGP